MLGVRKINPVARVTLADSIHRPIDIEVIRFATRGEAVVRCDRFNAIP